MNILKALFAGGSQSLNVVDAKARIDDTRQPVFILDVRQPEEFRAGHIPGARLIPLGELQRRMDELPQDTEILCVCHSGSRSGAAAGKLTRAGFNAMNMQSGMFGWQRAGYPIKKGK